MVGSAAATAYIDVGPNATPGSKKPKGEQSCCLTKEKKETEEKKGLSKFPPLEEIALLRAVEESL
jgi:hypothetical protein